MLKPDLLKNISYFAHLPSESLQELAGQSVRQNYHRQQLIFLENEKTSGLYYLESGRVRLFTGSASGKEQNLRIVRPGAVFNLVAALDKQPNSTSAAALEEITVWHLPAAFFSRLLDREPSVARPILSELAAEVRHLTVLVNDLSLRQVTARVAKLLLAQTESSSVPGIGLSNLVSAEITQQEIATSIGTVREMVGRVLATMKKEGAIQARRGQIIILDRQRLAKFLD